MRGKIIKWALICLVVSVLSGTLAYVYMRPYLPKELTFPSAGKEQPEGDSVQEVFPGWRERERERALAVVLDNSQEARPQSGLEAAELVYEVPVEGGLTRFLAMVTQDIEILGPVRSTRPYITDLAREYGAILVHAGGSPEALDILVRDNIEHLDEINGNPQVQGAFWRTPDRPKPSNLYTSSEVLQKAAKSLEYKTGEAVRMMGLTKPDQEVNGKPVKDLTIFYPNRQAEARYVYNPQRKVFERFTAGKPHLSAKGEQLVAANVIIQYVHYSYKDGDGRLQLLMHGEGKALVFREGKVLPALWKKMPGEFTTYTDEKGTKLAMLPGPTWVQVVTSVTKVDY